MKTNVYENGQNEQLKDAHKVEKMKKTDIKHKIR